jgi:hypothetical protein
MALPTVTMLAPPSFGGVIAGTPSGTVYVPNAYNQIACQFADLDVLVDMGFVPVSSGQQPIAYLLGANFNTNTDQIITPYISLNLLYVPQRVLVTNASISLTTAVGGIYDTPSKGGTAIVASGQVYSALTTAVKTLNLTIAAVTREAVGNPLILSLTTAQGVAATADVYVFGDVLVR